MIDCKKIEEEIKQELKEELSKVMSDVTPRLVIIQVGDNPASNRYVKGKIADCEEVGIIPTLIKYAEDVSEERMLQVIDKMNNNRFVHGIIVQLPLPAHMDEQKIVQSIAPHKDVDGFTQNSPFTPCTPLGVLTLLDKMGVDVKGKIITLVGYGKLVNKPLFPILSNMGATMIVCRSNTPEWVRNHFTRHADIVISAVGKHGIIEKYSAYKNAIVIDCGIEVIDGKQYGDCDLEIYDYVDLVTPRIGGMGLMTRAALMMNVVKAWKEQTWVTVNIVT